MVESLARSILAHAATAPSSARAVRLLRGRRVRRRVVHTTKHDHMPPREVRLSCAALQVPDCRCVEAGRITYLLQVHAYLASFSISHPRYYCEARPCGLLVLHFCLSGRPACLPASILVCAMLSALCPVLPSCTRAHTGLASSGRELGVVAGNAPRQSRLASTLPSTSARICRLLPELSTPNSLGPLAKNAGQTMRLRSLPVLENQGVA